MVSFPFIILGMRMCTLIGLKLSLGNKAYNKLIKVATLVTPVAPNGVKWFIVLCSQQIS